MVSPDSPPGSSPPTGGEEQTFDLSPPMFSESGGSKPLPSFTNLEVYLANPNLSSVSEIHYSTSPGVWQTYGGEGIRISPGTTIEAFVASTDPANWNNSQHVIETYDAIHVPLVIGLAFSKHAYTYCEMGGTMIPGIYPPNVVSSGTAALLNRNAIPSEYLNSSSFSINQILPNGEVPVVLDADFAGPIAISLASFGGGSAAAFEVAARSHVSGILDSKTVQATVRIEPTILPPPIIAPSSPPSGDDDDSPNTPGNWISIDLDTALGNTPDGAKIYYTLDGSDPGVDSGGGPTSPTAVLYSGAFSATPSLSAPVKARVYGPSGYEHWFVVSELSVFDWGLGPGIGFALSASLSAPTLAIDVTATAAPVISGTGVDLTARFPNVATVNGQSIDLHAQILSQTTNKTNTFWHDADLGDFVFQFLEGETGEVRSATVRWTFYESGSNNPVSLGDISLTIDDLDHGDSRHESLESSDISSFTLNDPTNLTTQIVASNVSVASAGGVEQNPGEPEAAVRLAIQNASFTIIYHVTFGTADRSAFHHDGSGTFSFTNPTTTPVPNPLSRIYYTYQFDNTTDSPVPMQFNDRAPSGFRWDSTYAPFVPNAAFDVEISYADSDYEAEASLVVPPGGATMTLRTLLSNTTGAIENEATVTPTVESGFAPLTATTTIPID